VRVLGLHARVSCSASCRYDLTQTVMLSWRSACCGEAP
jgi:hypothetical protein